MLINGYLKRTETFASHCILLPNKKKNVFYVKFNTYYSMWMIILMCQNYQCYKQKCWMYPLDNTCVSVTTLKTE